MKHRQQSLGIKEPELISLPLKGALSYIISLPIGTSTTQKGEWPVGDSRCGPHVTRGPPVCNPCFKIT